MPDFDLIIARHAAERPDHKVYRASEVPPTWTAITDDWLTDIICADVPGARVTSFSFDARDDGTSNRRRIFLAYNAAGVAAGLPASVFCKAADTLQNRLSMASSGISRIEADFYRCARPLLDMEAPKAWHAAFDPDNHSYIVVLHDMGGQVEFCDDRTIIDRERVESMMDELARLHGRFHAHPDLGTVRLPFSTWHDYWAHLMHAAPQFAASCDRAFGDSEELMSPALFRRRAEIWPATGMSVARHRHLPHTLAHGDVHLKNWYIAPENRMGLGDWQAVTAAHWSRDLIYAIVTALEVEDRRNWQQDLLRFYIDRMAAYGVPGISYDEALLNCRQQIFTALAFWTITLRPAPGMPDMQPERTARAFLRRLYAAIEDLDALDSFR